MSRKWREMTLTEAYPYWILGDVPAEDLPFIACNDMLAGNEDEEIVALAALSQPDAWDLAEVLPRAFARLGLLPMTRKEAAKSVALDKMRSIAERLVAGEEDPLRGANAIYFCASDAGLFTDDDDLDQKVTEYGTEFLQLADALEARWGKPSQRRQFEELIVEAAAALLAGRPTPTWHSDGSGDLHRGRAPLAADNTPTA